MPFRPAAPDPTTETGEPQQASDRVTASSDVGPKPTATKPKVRVDSIRVSDLPAFARAAAADPVRYAVLPIPPQRADAQAKNPLARPDDIGLLVGYVGDRCAGFLGLLPGAIEFRGRRHPMSSLTGFYVAPGDRTSGLGTMLPLGAIGLGRDLYVCRISAEAYSLFTQLGFWPARPQRTLRLQLSRFRKLKGIPLRMLGRSVNAGGSGEKWTLVTEARVPMTASWTDGNGHPETADPGEAGAGAQGAPGAGASGAAAATQVEPPRFVRDEAVINWMVRNPWIGEDSHVVLPYAFSYRREMFRYMVFEANSGGYVVLNVTQDQRFARVRILDRCPMTEAGRESALARAVLEAQRLVADVVECPPEYEPLLRRSFAGRKLLAVDERAALVHTRDPEGPFGKHLDTIAWSGFEGDAPFF
jgi:hypothetical protein